MLKENVDLYFIDGCGRCPLGGTPNCKVNNWPNELQNLRRIVLECGLNEELKWGVPVYTYQNKNVAIVAAFKEFCCLSFFKGALLSNSDGLLVASGENAQSAKLIKFTNNDEILRLETMLKAYVFEAIEVEKLGLKIISKKPEELPFPTELSVKLATDPIFKKAFEALTPGRQKGYIFYFSQPKQSKTRVSRIENSLTKILSGKGVSEY